MSYERTDPDRNPAESGSSGPSIKLIALALVVVALAVFVFQNGDDAHVQFLWIDVQWPISVVIGISVLAGIVLDRLGTWMWRRGRRRDRTDEA